jgi:AhpD family alkylhydroperoxidase
MNDKTKRLIAVGASVSANCQQCLRVNAHKALQNGCTAEELAEAIEIGRLVARGAGSKMNAFISQLSPQISGVKMIGNCACD